MTLGTLFASRFLIEAEIGRGGFATVYRAMDQMSGEAIALKLIREAPNNPGYNEIAARFQREIHIVSQLRDPHTVQYRGHGNEDGQLWVAFEFLDGEDLSAHLARHGRLAAAGVRALALQVLCSLEEAHKLGLVHRDLKPSNIRMLPDGAVTYAVDGHGVRPWG